MKCETKGSMRKDKKELPSKYDAVKSLIVKKLAEKHNCTASFVRQCIRENSDKKSELAGTIRREFRMSYNQAHVFLSKI